MANYDMWEWSQTVKHKNSGLVNPQMFISKAGTDYTISIGWDESRQGLTVTDCGPPPAPAGTECVSIVVTP